jgi:hypothetical protein
MDNTIKWQMGEKEKKHTFLFVILFAFAVVVASLTVFFVDSLLFRLFLS